MAKIGILHIVSYDSLNAAGGVGVSRIQITGGIRLKGEVRIQGSKNAALPLMAASVLHQGKTVLHNCPDILDVEYMSEILKELGCTVRRESDSLVIDASDLHGQRISERYATRLRASVILLGGLLGRRRLVEMPYPGGCSIGMRPIDLHIRALEKMGAAAEAGERRILLSAERLSGADIQFPFPSVGATENGILAAVLAEGDTTLRGCAMEPEIGELCEFLRQKGAGIEENGRDVTIHGAAELQDSEYTLMPDRIVAGTYLCAAAGTRGNVVLTNTGPEYLTAPMEILKKTGAVIETGTDWVQIDGTGAEGPVEYMETAPYPGFPTDLQSQMMAVLTEAEGISTIRENVFDSRFLTVEELEKMGAEIRTEHGMARIEGPAKLHGTGVISRDLRGGAALVIAGLMAAGTTTVDGCHLIDRGYVNICRDLKRLGARISRS